MNRSNLQALAAATTIANRMADPHALPNVGSGRRRPQSLAGGAAGIALLHIEWARAGHGDWTTAHAWLSAAVRDDLSAGLTPACSSVPRLWRSSPTRRPIGQENSRGRSPISTRAPPP